jgi:acetylornithine deacetylase/succinyl-diaminopimelate desuccinylase-like protein
MTMKRTLFAAALLAATAQAADLDSQVDAYRQTHEAAIVDQFAEFVRLKSVAADLEGLQAAAHFLEQALQSRGFDVKELTAVAGMAPVVFGAFKSPHAKRTVIYYAHYDGQPVTPSQWSSDPFEPVMRSGASLKDPTVDWHRATPPYGAEWRLYGRAAGDDKVTIAAFLAAFDALKSAHRSPSVNLKVLWEGEEEAGSPHLKQVLQDNRALLAADLFLVGDGPVHQSRKPLVYFGARGSLELEATLYGPLHALHDGHYGNWAPNPAAMAATLISQLRDDEGRILIPGFSEHVRPLTPDETQALAAMPPYDEELKHEFGLGRSEGSESLALSLMRPALNVRGMRSGQVGAAAANAVPIDATISIDFRLVPDQTIAEVHEKTEAYLRSKGWTIVANEPDLATRLKFARIVRVVWSDAGYPALRSDMSTPAAKAVIAAARKAARGPLIVAPQLGGSVPLYLIDDLFHVPIVGIPIANHDDNQHAANENLRLQNFWDGIDTYAALMAELNW